MRSPGTDAGLGGRRVVDRRHHLDDAVLHGDFDAEAAELALGLDLHVLVGLGVHVARMRVERGQHAVDGVLDQRLLVDRLDIVAPHALEHVAEQIELLIELALVAAARPWGRSLSCDHAGKARGAARKARIAAAEARRRRVIGLLSGCRGLRPPGGFERWAKIQGALWQDQGAVGSRRVTNQAEAAALARGRRE